MRSNRRIVVGESVGFVGIGLMGKGMARNVLKKGFDLTVHNRSRAPVDELAREGAHPADTPAELASKVRVICSCLPGPADVEKVYLGENGVLTGATAGSTIVEMSTIDPGTHKRVAERAKEKGIDYLDAPVSGGTTGARDGTLTIMVGGDAAVLERVRPVLDAMGQRIYHIGPTGAGAVVKLVNNMMSAISALGVFEGMVLGVKAGLDPETMLEILSNSSASSRTLSSSVPNILKGNFEPGFMVDLMHKDVALAVELGKESGVRLLAGALAEQILQETRSAGFGRQNTTAQIIPLERNAGVEVRARNP